MIKYKYVRVQGQELAENTMYAKGVFSMCWQLIQNDDMIEDDEDDPAGPVAAGKV